MIVTLGSKSQLTISKLLKVFNFQLKVFDISTQNMDNQLRECDFLSQNIDDLCLNFDFSTHNFEFYSEITTFNLQILSVFLESLSLKTQNLTLTQYFDFWSQSLAFFKLKILTSIAETVFLSKNSTQYGLEKFSIKVKTRRKRGEQLNICSFSVKIRFHFSIFCLISVFWDILGNRMNYSRHNFSPKCHSFTAVCLSLILSLKPPQTHGVLTCESGDLCGRSLMCLI